MISYQLYSSRNFFPVENTLSLIRKHGCTECEGVAFFIITEDADETTKNIHALKQHLDANTLTMPTIHIMVDHLQLYPDALLQCADVLGCHTFIVAYVMEQHRPSTATGWQDFAKQVKSHARPLTDKGLQIGWHNHDFEYAPVDGSYPMAEMLKAYPEMLWEADVAWMHVAKVDPIVEIQKYADRLCAVHVKDIAPEGQNKDQDGWCNVGEGVLDWYEILTAVRKHTTVKHFILEHDNPASDTEFASVSIPYLKNTLKKIG